MPTKTLEIEPMLIATIEHIDQSMVDQLEAWGEDGRPHEMPRFIPHKHGFILHVPDVEDLLPGAPRRQQIEAMIRVYGLDEKLLALYLFAQANSCEWINLDVDGPALDGVPLRYDREEGEVEASDCLWSPGDE